MTDKLPQNLLNLFQPRPPVRYLPPNDKPPEDRKTTYITGVAQYVDTLQGKAARAKEADDGELEPHDEGFEAPPTESWLEKRDRETLEKQSYQQWLTTKGAEEIFTPNEDANIRGDPYRTLFVGRLSYETEVKDLEREFGRFGALERVRIVTDSAESARKEQTSRKKGKSRGYAFVVFEKEKDMKGSIRQLLEFV